MTWPDGSQYEGDWREGVRHGTGKMKWQDADPHQNRCYNGDWDTGLQDGQGLMVWGGRGSYQGQWKKGEIVNPDEILRDPTAKAR